MFGTPLWSRVKTQRGLFSGDKKSPTGFGDSDFSSSTITKFKFVVLS